MHQMPKEQGHRQYADEMMTVLVRPAPLWTPFDTYPNLSILSESLVDRITFSGNRATGILLANRRHILATPKVIPSACAILSLAIVQRSGIGPFPAPPPTWHPVLGRPSRRSFCL